MSAGSMSLVNWMRWKSSPSSFASTCASVVLPTPGRSSMRRCPRASMHASARRIWRSLPRIIFPACWMTPWISEKDIARNYARRLLIVVSLLESRYDGIAGIKFMATAFITHGDCARHDMGRHHPESPARLAAIEDHLIASGVAGLIERHEAPAAKISELARVHPLEYIEAIREASPRSGIVHLDPDTAM